MLLLLLVLPEVLEHMHLIQICLSQKVFKEDSGRCFVMLCVELRGNSGWSSHETSSARYALPIDDLTRCNAK